MSNTKSAKMLLPGLSIVFGSGVGVVASMLYNFHIAIGIIGGAAVGLLFGLIALMLFGKRNRAEGRD